MKKTKLTKIIRLITGIFALLLIINCSSKDNPEASTPSAQIVVTGNILNFGNINVLSHSTSQNIQVKGTNRVGNITISAPTNFEISRPLHKTLS